MTSLVTKSCSGQIDATDSLNRSSICGSIPHWRVITARTECTESSMGRRACFSTGNSRAIAPSRHSSARSDANLRNDGRAWRGPNTFRTSCRPKSTDRPGRSRQLNTPAVGRVMTGTCPVSNRRPACRDQAGNGRAHRGRDGIQIKADQ